MKIEHLLVGLLMLVVLVFTYNMGHTAGVIKGIDISQCIDDAYTLWDPNTPTPNVEYCE